MTEQVYTPEQIIEWWKCCSMQFPDRDCGACPVSSFCWSLDDEEAVGFFKALAIRAAELLNDTLEREKKRQWISVKDTVPETNGAYLCYYGFRVGDIETVEHIGVIEYITQDERPHWQNENIGLFVTRWMPLPAPPEAEEKNQ